MDRLKELLLSTDSDNIPDVKDRVEVVGMSISSCLNRAAEHLNLDLSMLDYEIIERGKRSFMNLNPKPFRLMVSKLPESARFADLEELSLKMGVGDRLLDESLSEFVRPKDVDGRALVRIYRTGVFLTVFPPKGDGIPERLDHALLHIQHSGVKDFDREKVEQIIKESRGEPVKIAEYVPVPENDSAVKVDLSPDEMKAYVRITPPRPGGRHLEVRDVVSALKSYGVLIGFMEEDIHHALIEDRYMQDILAAKGQPVKHGEDAKINYKVNIRKDKVHFEEDAAGKVDFKKMNLVENVVVGQILAEKIPAQRGIPGRNLFNRIIDARDGKDIELLPGKNTILSEDGMKLIAEINGQVVVSGTGKINVEPIHRVIGDVGPKTGNIMFLGSVVITGSILDNYEVKAAGNVEVIGSVQKARIEAEGDILVKQGILGREEAYLESTGGSLIARFIQSAHVKVAQDVQVQEGILHSTVEAGNSIKCNGRRAQIVGGNIRAKKEVRARIIGSQAYTTTDITVGTDPRILAQHEELMELFNENEDKLKRMEKSKKTLVARKKNDPEAFSEEQEEMLEDTNQSLERLVEKKNELQSELEKVNEFMDQLGSEGKVHAEKEIFPGVNIHIKDATQPISDTYNSVTLTYDTGHVKINKLEKDEEIQGRYGRRR